MSSLLIIKAMFFGAVIINVINSGEEKFGLYWSTRRFAESDATVTFHFRKMFQREYASTKSDTSYNPNTIGRLCSPNGGAPPSLEDLDNSPSLHKFLALDIFRPYLVMDKYPVLHGFYLSTQTGAKAALWVQIDGRYRVDYWLNNSKTVVQDMPKTNVIIQHPDDVVCMVRQLITTSPQPQVVNSAELTTSHPSGLTLHCLTNEFDIDYMSVMQTIGTLSSKENKSRTKFVGGNSRRDVFPSQLDWFLIRQRYWLFGITLFCLVVLCLMAILATILWLTLRQVTLQKCKSTPQEADLETLLKTGQNKSVAKRLNIVYIPTPNAEYGSIAARRQRDTLRRSMANMVIIDDLKDNDSRSDNCELASHIPNCKVSDATDSIEYVETSQVLNINDMNSSTKKSCSKTKCLDKLFVRSPSLQYDACNNHASSCFTNSVRTTL